MQTVMRNLGKSLEHLVFEAGGIDNRRSEVVLNNGYTKTHTRTHAHARNCMSHEGISTLLCPPLRHAAPTLLNHDKIDERHSN